MIDFIDFGCGTGGSINWVKTRFGGETHLGLTNREHEVETAIKNGYNVKLQDITNDDVELPKCRYVSMLHFLEHLKDEQTVEKVISKAINLASEFVFIKVPYFDQIEYLKNLGLRLTWTNWIGHPTAVTSEMLKNITDKFSKQAKIGFLYPIIDSDSNEIIPISSPVDTVLYDVKLEQKKHIELINVYRETYCFININCEKFEEIIKTNIL